MAQPPDADSKTQPPSNIPGLAAAREVANIWGQMFTANLDTCNKLWAEARQGEVSFQSLLGHTAGAVQRYVEDLAQLARAPFSDTDRPDWAIFWYDLDAPSLNMIKRVTLGRRYPSTMELHGTDLQMLGQNAKIPAANYHAVLENDGRTLTVQLDQVPPTPIPAVGDYVGLVTAQGLVAPLAVVMVTVRNTKSTTSVYGSA
jgi:hypothetical protein